MRRPARWSGPRQATSVYIEVSRDVAHTAYDARMRAQEEVDVSRMNDLRLDNRARGNVPALVCESAVKPDVGIVLFER